MTSTATTVAPARYSLGRTTAEYERVRRQAELWQSATERVLDRVGLGEGARCLEAGCGPGVTMRQLAQRVGPHGIVVGVDADPMLGRTALARLHADGHRQCAFHVHDLRGHEPLPGAPYDLVYQRLVLFHLPERVDVLRRLWDAVVPGGTLVVQDYDVAVTGAVPPLPGVDRAGELILAAFGAAGCEVRAGSLLPRLFAEAGVGEPDGTDVAGRLDPLAEAGRMLEQVLTSLEPVAVARGLASASEVAAALAGLHAEMADDPQHPVLWPLLQSAWKRKAA